MPSNYFPPSLENYLTVSEAAALIGVSSETLRNWDRKGKLKPHRHPVNGYRLYSRVELEAVLHQISDSRLQQSGMEKA